MPHIRAANNSKNDDKFLLKLSNIGVGESLGMEYDAVVNKCSAIAQLEPGASHAFMSPKAAADCVLSVVSAEEEEVELRNRSIVKTSGRVRGRWVINGYITEEDIFLLPMPDTSHNLPVIVIGRRWLVVDNPHVDWVTNDVHVTRKDGTKKGWNKLYDLSA